MKNYLRVGALVKPTGNQKNCWTSPNVVLRVAKRKKTCSFSWSETFKYFVVAIGDPVGHGVWAIARDLRPLNALELLAQASE